MVPRFSIKDMKRAFKANEGTKVNVHVMTDLYRLCETSKRKKKTIAAREGGRLAMKRNERCNHRSKVN